MISSVSSVSSASSVSHPSAPSDHGGTSKAAHGSHAKHDSHAKHTKHATHGERAAPAAPAANAPPSAFDALNLIEPLRRALRDSGYETPTPIQAQSIPLLLEGRDILGCAQTGTGKTAAFALPIIQRLHGTQRRGTAPRALILAPTRELALQIADSFVTYGRHTKLSGTTVFGGVSQYHQVKALRRGIDVLVATPGRLLDLMEQGVVDLSAIEIFVLDEADRMLDMGFIQPIRRIAATVPKTRQTLLFSATMPTEIKHLAESLLSDPARVSVATDAAAAPKIAQSVYLVTNAGKVPLLEKILSEKEVGRSLVFVRTKHGADKLCRRLEEAGFRAGAIHGNKAQAARQRALDAFRSGRMPILVATDVAARGIDVDEVSHVINFDLPYEPEAYVHRIGRTGRAGAVGAAIAFCDREERGLLRAIERLIGNPIERAEGSDASMDIGPAGPAMKPGGGRGKGRSGGGNPVHGAHGGHGSRGQGGRAGPRGRSPHGARSPREGDSHRGGRGKFAAPHGGERTGTGAGARGSKPASGSGSPAGRLNHPSASSGPKAHNASSWNRPTKRR